MTAKIIFRILGYVSSVILFVFGLCLLTGFFGFHRIVRFPEELRTIFSIVLMLYGIYRFVVLKFKRRDDEFE